MPEFNTMHIKYTHTNHINNNKIKMGNDKRQLDIRHRTIDKQQNTRTVEMTMVKEEKCREMKSKSLNHHDKMQILDMNTPYKTLLMKLDEKKMVQIIIKM